MPDTARVRFVNDVLADPAVREHLARVVRGEGRWFPASDGGQRFACDTGGDPGGCAWCDTVAWPAGNPLDAD